MSATVASSLVEVTNRYTFASGPEVGNVAPSDSRSFLRRSSSSIPRRYCDSLRSCGCRLLYASWYSLGAIVGGMEGVTIGVEVGRVGKGVRVAVGILGSSVLVGV